MTKSAIERPKQHTFLDEIQGWDQLNTQEQELVRSESHALGEELYFARKSRFAVGRSLVALRAILEPKRMWAPFLQNGFGMSKSTAYNYINEFSVLNEKLTSAFVEIAMRRGLNLSPSVIDSHPPPKTEDPEKILHYLETIDKIKPGPVAVELKPEEVVRNCVQYVLSRYSRLPKRARMKFAQDFVSILLGKMGMAGSQSFIPESLPDKIAVFRSRVKAKVA